ncbi:hypothetical protein ACIA5E_22135 [Nocardia asteroides]|uniref:hypothetical protein n=1 Tax=Nocardia asteroides TaxID=1824 RepID=UPI00378E08BA
MTATFAPLPLPDLSRFGGGTWQPVPLTLFGTTYTAYRADMTDPGYIFFGDPSTCTTCNDHCRRSAFGADCSLCDHDICHQCGYAYNGSDLS